jgi:hypothetical protein
MYQDELAREIRLQGEAANIDAQLVDFDGQIKQVRAYVCNVIVWELRLCFCSDSTGRRRGPQGPEQAAATRNQPPRLLQLCRKDATRARSERSTWAPWSPRPVVHGAEG